ncbi:MAG: DNA polymerase III subunit delta [Pseudomonadota bacterium]
MRVYPESFSQTIHHQLPFLTWLHGEEQLLVEEGLEALRSLASQQGYSERQIFHVDKQFDWSEILFAVNDVGLFASRKVIECRLQGLPTKAGKDALIQIANRPIDDIIIIITSPKIENSTQKTKWFKQIDEVGVHVPCWPIGREKLSGWLKERAKRHHVHLEPQAFQLLVELVEGNLYAARQEIEKLSLIFGSQSISLQELEAAVSDNARFNVFALIDAMISGDAKRVLSISQTLQKEGQAIIGIIALIARELRLLLDLSMEVEKGKSPAQVTTPPKVWASRKLIVQSALQRLQHRQLHRLLNQCIRLDTAAKSSGSHDLWLQLKSLALEIAGVDVWQRQGKHG